MYDAVPPRAPARDYCAHNCYLIVTKKKLDNSELSELARVGSWRERNRDSRPREEGVEQMFEHTAIYALSLAIASENPRATYAQKVRLLADRVKVSAGCAVCGFDRNPRALEFDHINPATKYTTASGRVVHPSDMMSGRYSLGTVIAEMLKCRVICARCHAIHSAEQRGNFLTLPFTTLEGRRIASHARLVFDGDVWVCGACEMKATTLHRRFCRAVAVCPVCESNVLGDYQETCSDCIDAGQRCAECVKHDGHAVRPAHTPYMSGHRAHCTCGRCF